MDTFKDRQQLDSLWGSGNAPWHVWRNNGTEDIREAAPVPVAEFLDRRSAVGNGITGSRKPARN
jgi:hypothetical protein